MGRKRPTNSRQRQDRANAKPLVITDGISPLNREQPPSFTSHRDKEFQARKGLRVGDTVRVTSREYLDEGYHAVDTGTVVGLAPYSFMDYGVVVLFDQPIHTNGSLASVFPALCLEKVVATSAPVLVGEGCFDCKVSGVNLVCYVNTKDQWPMGFNRHLDRLEKIAPGSVFARICQKCEDKRIKESASMMY